GAGKTRLALQAAADLVDAYPEGVWLTELAPVTDGEMIRQALASVLRVNHGADLMGLLEGRLRAARLLLVLDNCEHLIEPLASMVDRLLKACPGLSILATSRAAFGISGE